jgi:hypothetical protein
MATAASLDSTMNIANEMTQRLGFNPQATYAPVIRDTFYQLVPANMKFYYYNAIRRSLYWYQGYVPEIHNPSAGIMSTGIGNTIVKELTKLIIGGRIFFENAKKEKNPRKVINKTLELFNFWSDEYKFQDTFKTLLEFAIAGGTSLSVSYVNGNSDLVIMPFRIDQCFYEVDLRNDCSHFTGFIAYYTAKIQRGNGRKEDENQYYLVEERYYDDNLKPIKRFNIKKGTTNVTTAQSFDVTNTNNLSWEQLPKVIQKQIKKEFPDIKIGVDIPINFTDDLGVDIIKYTTTNRIPEVKMGESALLNIFKYLIDYEYAESALDTDMYLARGKVLLPEQMHNPTDSIYQSYYSGYDSPIYTKMPMVNTEEQKPIVIQFDLRPEEWVKTRNNTVEKIAFQIGISGSDLASFLKDASGGSKTATQIASESQKTVSYIYDKRDIFKNAFMPFIKRWKEFYSQPDEITLKFSSQNMVNKLVSLEELRVYKELGMSTEDLFKLINPDKDDNQIKEMVDRKFAEQKAIALMTAQVDIQAFNDSLIKPNGRKSGDGIIETTETTEPEDKEEVIIKE